MRNRLRLISGLILFVFVTGHLINHSLGLISIEAAGLGTRLFIDPWRTLLGGVLLYGAVIVHAGCAVWSLWVRRSLRMPAWELMQMVLGFCAPLMLAAHVAATRGLAETSDFDPGYEFVVGALWVSDPVAGFLQGLAVVVVWVHGCLGLHTWLRLKPWYLQVQSLAFMLAVALPAMALGGYVAMGSIVKLRAEEADWWAWVTGEAGLQDWMPTFVHDVEDGVRIAVVMTLLSIVVVQATRRFARRVRRQGVCELEPSGKRVPLVPGATLLETLRAANISHASICGGRGRCSTCRVRVTKGLSQLAAMDETERKVLSRHTSSDTVRLACQIRPQADIAVSALVPADITPIQLAKSPDYMQGREMTVAFLFVDLRGSTKLCEDRLPFDVVFILNQFFAELSKALEETNGHYAQFNGDGLMAIYGLRTSPEEGAASSILGAQAMLRRIDALNARLKEELNEPLRIGIGIHLGPAVVGSMGPPETPIVSALGDTVNIAARLESLTKEYGVPLVISKAVADHAEIAETDLQAHLVPVKGRAAEIDIFAVDRPDDIAIARRAAAAE